MDVKTPASLLQELCVQENNSSPMYESVPHEKDPKMFSYVVEAFGYFAKGNGRSKKEAKHEASAKLISKFFPKSANYNVISFLILRDINS